MVAGWLRDGGRVVGGPSSLLQVPPSYEACNSRVTKILKRLMEENLIKLQIKEMGVICSYNYY
jgi:hypothetical protein